MEDIILPEPPRFTTAKMSATDLTPGMLLTRGRSEYEVYGRGTEYQKFRRLGNDTLIEVRGPTTDQKVGDTTHTYFEDIGFIEGRILGITGLSDGSSIYHILAIGPSRQVVWNFNKQEEKEDRSWMKPEDLI